MDSFFLGSTIDDDEVDNVAQVAELTWPRFVRIGTKQLPGKLMMRIVVALLPVSVDRILNSILVEGRVEDSRRISSRLDSKR
jgi:hypothetical protein